MIFLRGDRRNKFVRRYCEWLERMHPQIYNRGNLATNKTLAAQIGSASTEQQSDDNDGEAEEEATTSTSTAVVKAKGVTPADSDSSDSTPSPEKKKKPVSKGNPGGIKASTRTNLRKSASNQISNGPDEKHRPAGSSAAGHKGSKFGRLPVRSTYRPPASRVRPLPNVIVKPVPALPPPTAVKQTKPRVMAKPKVKVAQVAAATTDRKMLITSSTLVTAPATASTPNIQMNAGINSNQPAPIRTYGSKSKIVPFLAENTILASGGGDLTLSLPSTTTTPATPTPVEIPTLSAAATTIIQPNSTMPTLSNPPKQVVFSGRNIARSLMVQTPVQSILSNQQNQKSTPILIRSLNPTQIQQTQSGGAGGTTTAVIQTSSGGIQIPTSGMQFTVGPGGSPGFALVNIRGGLGGIPTVLRGNVTQSFTGSQVVRFLQQSGLLLQQQPMAGGQAGQGGISTVNTTLPLTVRLPVSAVQTVQSSGQQGSGTAGQVVTMTSSSAAVCSTASAIVAANNTVRLAARSGVTGVTQFQLVSRSPNTIVSTGSGGTVTSTSTAVARTPIPAVGISMAGNRVVKPGTVTTASGIRAATMTASQLRSALAGGTHAVIRAQGNIGNITTLRTATGQNIAGNVRVSIPTSGGGMTRAILTQGSSPRTASGMLRPVTIATAGMRPLNATVRATVSGGQG